MPEVVVITQKSDMSAFARKMEKSPITWRSVAGPGGTIILVPKD